MELRMFDTRFRKQCGICAIVFLLARIICNLRATLNFHAKVSIICTQRKCMHTIYAAISNYNEKKVFIFQFDMGASHLFNCFKFV